MNKFYLRFFVLSAALCPLLLCAMDASIVSPEKAVPPSDIERPIAFPLHRAIAQGFITESRLLVDHNSPLELRDADGHTPLQVVFNSHLNSHTRIVLASILIEAGASMEVLDAEKSPLLFSLIKKVNLDGVRLLLGYGVNLRSTNFQGRMPLIYADEKVNTSENPKTEEISDLIAQYLDGKRKPEFAHLIQTQAERARLCAAAHQSVLAALRQQREVLEEQMRLRQAEAEHLAMLEKSLHSSVDESESKN
ncbi:MAG: hypothetical protein AB7F19_07335 [Candidatus Babeliales bacterium]